MFISMLPFQLDDFSPKDFVLQWQSADFSDLFIEFRAAELSLWGRGDTGDFLLKGEFFEKSALRSLSLKNEARLFLGQKVFLGDPSLEVFSNSWELLARHAPGKSDYRSNYLDELVGRHFSQESHAQKKILLTAEQNGLPPIQVPSVDGRLLEILVELVSGRRGVEIGTLGGYSASWLLKGMCSESQDSMLWGLELEEDRAELARQNLISCGYSESQFRILSGDARSLLQKHTAEWTDLDFVFIDANKADYPFYFQWAVDHLRVGGIVLVDNSYVFGGMRHFEIENFPESLKKEWGRFDLPTKTQILGMKKCWEMMRDHPQLKSIQVPTGEGLGLSLKVC